MALQMNSYLNAIFKELQSCKGFGIDNYHPQVTYHVMADAFFVLGLIELSKRAKGEVRKNLQQEITLACERILESANREEDKIGFGLGFPWRGFPSSESYTITTAIVGMALNNARSFLKFRYHRIVHRELQGIDNWFLDLPTLPHEGFQFLAYGPRDYEPGVVLNVVTMGHGYKCIRGLAKKIECKNLHFLLKNQKQIHTWAYSNLSQRVDLLHNCYIIEGMSECKEYDNSNLYCDSLRVLFEFVVENRLVDKGDLINSELKMLPSPARAMSLGSLVGILGKSKILICQIKCTSHFHCKVIQERIENLRDSNMDLRSKAHLFFGLSRHADITQMSLSGKTAL